MALGRFPEHQEVRNLFRGKMENIRFIFFDAVGTLFKVKGSVGDIYANVAKNYGVKLSANDLNDSFKTVFKNAPPLCFPGVSPKNLFVYEKNWWQNLVEKIIPINTFSSNDQFNEFFETLFNVFAKGSSWELFPDTHPTLNGLKEIGIRMGIISNFDSRLLKILDELKISTFFEKVICSTKIGFAKPQLEIFQKAMPNDLTPDQIAMVGNELKIDILPANQFQMSGIWLNRKGYPTKEIPNQIRSLTELL